MSADSELPALVHDDNQVVECPHRSFLVMAWGYSAITVIVTDDVQGKIIKQKNQYNSETTKSSSSSKT